MSRYVIKFSKEGNIRYISHLDLLRLFKRSFKRVGVKLLYSQGFNPHPKMSFAQPLSLGYSGLAEYLELETSEPCDTGEILEKTSAVMPEGIRLYSCEELSANGKTLASLTEAASYEITIPAGEGFRGTIETLLKEYLERPQIPYLKHQKKSGKDVEVDIKPMIAEISGTVNDNNIMLTMKLAAGSTANLSPEIVLASFFEFAGISYDRAEVSIMRTEIYFGNN